MATALAALTKAMKNKLRGGPLCADRAYPDHAPAGVERPYIVFFFASGGEDNQRQSQDASFVFGVKCVAEDRDTSMQGAAWISEQLNDAGSQDDQAFPCGDGWTITTCTQDRAIHLVEMFAGASDIYHDGNQYQIVMEAN